MKASQFFNNRFSIPLIMGVLLALVVIVQLVIEHQDTVEKFLTWLQAMEAEESLVANRLKVAKRKDELLEELRFFHKVEQEGLNVREDFRELTKANKWQVIESSNLKQLFNEFEQLLEARKIGYSGESAVDFSNPDVAAHVGSLVLGFRKLVADFLWIRVDAYFHEGLVERMLPLIHSVVALDPHFLDAYAVGAWHMAYNIAYMVHTAVQRLEYMNQAVLFLQDGIKKNSRNHRLYYELGFAIYFLKFKDYAKAAYYLEQAVKYEHPPWVERAYCLSLERDGREKEALRLLEQYDVKYPDYVLHKITLSRLRQKVLAKDYEEKGQLEAALSLWEIILKDSKGYDSTAPQKIRQLRVRLNLPVREYEPFEPLTSPSLFEEG